MADLEGIGDHIAADNPARAVSFIEEILAAGDDLARMPLAFGFAPGLERKRIRRRVHGRYLIFYRVEAGAVQILHVAHGARDYIRALFPDV